MHGFSSKSPSNLSKNADLDLTSTSISPILQKSPILTLEMLQNEEFLEQVITSTIEKQRHLKSEKSFYESLKPKPEPTNYASYCYKSKGVKPPTKEFKSKQPRFITFKVRSHRMARNEFEKPLFDQSMLTEAIKNQDSQVYNYKVSTLTKNNSLNKSIGTKTPQIRTSSIPKSGVKPAPSTTNKGHEQSSLEMIKKICDEYGMSRRQVFEIHSQYKAMTIPFTKPKKEDGTTAEDDYMEAVKKEKNKMLGINDNDKSVNHSRAERSGLDLNQSQTQTDTKQESSERVDGIKIDYFVGNCTFLHGVHHEVKIRLLKALGIDTERKNSVIKWEEFVELYSICELGQLNKSELIRFWVKFLDPSMLGIVSESSIEDILEKLVRGTSLNEANQGTLLFAKSIIKSYKMHNCGEIVNSEKFINISKVRELFMEGTVTMQNLSDALGNKALSDHAIGDHLLDGA